ncbi:MAG: cyclomaltodextrinase [Lachnospiraceae bacterium]|nr:cyclomaltodextrinase [Candidatus Colinaster equi]
MWSNECVFYQIYPLGLCGAPFENDGKLAKSILSVADYIPHLTKLGIGAIYFSPIFESDTHGYNTRDYRKIDVRIGTNEDFKKLVEKLHKAKIRVVIDGVFNHVGRGFFAFKDVLEHKWESKYKDWFYINFDGNSPYNDGLWYEGWEGNYDLVKLNLRNEEVVTYLLESVKYWIEYFDIDGIRLDVAYMVDRDYMRRLRQMCNSLKNDFYLVGEMIHGDYNQLISPDMLDSATNYECYKGIYSSLNSMNLFEINHSLQRQFGSEPWCLYTGKWLLSFVDNHDVSRIATILGNKNHIPLAFALMLGMPGIPCIYYGSEWGIEGNKQDGDPTLRPQLDKPQWTELTDTLAAWNKIRNEQKALMYGSFNSAFLTNRQCVMERCFEGERVLVAINADENSFTACFDIGTDKLTNLVNGETLMINGALEMPPYSASFYKV